MSVRQNNEVYNGSELWAPAGNAIAVAPSSVATNDGTLPIAIALYVGGAGNVDAIMAGGSGSVVTFVAVPAGAIIPIRVIRIAASSTATNMVFLYGVK
jgi:hypothetical protein